MAECLFCSIVAGEIESDIIHQDEHTIAFRDIYPVAKVHFLVIPKTHIEGIESLDESQMRTAWRLLQTARTLGEEHSRDHGYRLSINAGKQQEVKHLHVHVLGGQSSLDPDRGGDST